MNGQIPECACRIAVDGNATAASAHAPIGGDYEAIARLEDDFGAVAAEETKEAHAIVEAQQQLNGALHDAERFA